jgi:Zn-dependent protease
MGELGQGVDMVLLGRKLVLTLVTMILSLSVHEAAHAFAAWRLGDPTARKAGRLTLNPLVHIDPMGTLILPIASTIMAGGAFIGWAKPTPFRADMMRPGVNRRLGAAIVSVAGPASNLVLASLAFGGLAVMMHTGMLDLAEGESGGGWAKAAFAFLFQLGVLNVGLALFNMIPIPPLDGHRLLPPMFDPLVARIGRYGFGIVMLIFFLLPQVADVIFGRPYRFLVHGLASLFGLPFFG